MRVRSDVNCRGMTLVEILIALAVFSIISVVIYTFFAGQSKINATNQNIAAQREAAMYVLNVILKDLRMIGYNNGAAEDISSASSSSITFYTDWDNDTAVETYSYVFAGNKVRRQGATIFDQLNVQSLNFSYYDSSATEVSDLTSASLRASIREIHVRLQVRLPSSDIKMGINPTITLDGSVKPRNMGLE